jgi:hypothetical protein
MPQLASCTAFGFALTIGPCFHFRVIKHTASINVGESLDRESMPLLFKSNERGDGFFDDPSLWPIESLGQAVEPFCEIFGDMSGNDACVHNRIVINQNDWEV